MKYRMMILANRMPWSVVVAIVSQQPKGPTKPAVPIPAPAALLVILNHIVDTGPKMAEANVGASQMMG